MKYVVVFGTRPEAIKLAPVIQTLKQQSDMECIVCVTGQHREMLDQVLHIFNITPDHDLAIMQPNQDIFDITSNILNKIKRVLLKEKPDVVIVQGDTSTCMATALAAFYLKIPVAHIEAGLRTGDMYSPFPEEMNRCLVSRIAQWHFAPTQYTAENLLKEGINKNAIFVVGNTVIDALLWMVNKLEQSNCDVANEEVRAISKQEKPIILITGHRRENFGKGMENVCNAVLQLAQKHSEWLFVYPVHLNPHVQQPVNDMLGSQNNIKLIEPLEYASFVYLMDKAKLIISDSGGVQEEAPSLGKPVLVTREVTERIEAIDAGTVVLVGTGTDTIIKEVESLMRDQERYATMSRIRNPYGDGSAAKKIVQTLVAEASGEKHKEFESGTSNSRYL
ncbi:MAG: UDP-N-acetylglucosamine 2-epimerase (non-hydrolyzing) [Gammaproteobacteria bacterium]|nr:UDP-N-acetylglucosamine 2-epimerase (non-hydrolyzing) [Gammaproteobacteria bacterium]